MITNNENVKRLNPFKIIQYEDILKFARDNNKIINYSFLRKNNFNPEEIDIIYENNEIDILKNNCRIFESRLNKLLKQKNTIKKVEDVKPINNKKYNFIEFQTHWILETFNKSGRHSRIIDKDNVKDLFVLIKKLTKNKNDCTYSEIVSALIINNDLRNINVDSFNGGRNRKLYYRLYYYPLKVLSHLNKIKSKKGKIERL